MLRMFSGLALAALVLLAAATQHVSAALTTSTLFNAVCAATARVRAAANVAAPPVGAPGALHRRLYGASFYLLYADCDCPYEVAKVSTSFARIRPPHQSGGPHTHTRARSYRRIIWPHTSRLSLLQASVTQAGPGSC